MAGIVSEYDVTKTVSLARRLQPNARNLVVVPGGRIRPQGRTDCEQQLVDTEKQLKTRYLVGLSDETVDGNWPASRATPSSCCCPN